MNKKVILKEVAKTEIIKNLLYEGYSPNLLHRLIVEEFIREDENAKLKAYSKEQKTAYMKLTKEAGIIQLKFRNAKVEYNKQTEKSPVDLAFIQLANTYDNFLKYLTSFMINGENQENQLSYYEKMKLENKKINELLNATNVQGAENKKLEDYFESTKSGISGTYTQGDTALLINTMTDGIKLVKSVFTERFGTDPDGGGSESEAEKENEDSGEIPELILKFLKEIADHIVAEKLKGMEPEKIKDAEPEEIKTAVGLVGTLDDDNTSVSAKDIESGEKRGIPKDVLDTLLARGREIMSESVLTEATNKYPEFVQKVKNTFKTETALDSISDDNFSLMEKVQEFQDWFDSDAKINAAIAKIDELMKYPADVKIDNDLGKPSEKEEEEEDTIVDETRSVTKQVASKVYSNAPEGGKSFGNKITAFMDEFMKAKYIDEQTLLFNDLLYGIDKFLKELETSTKRATNESVVGKVKDIIKNAFDKKEISAIKQAELGFLKSLDSIIKNLENLEENGQKVLASAQKQFIASKAEEMQDQIKTLFDLINEGATPEKLEEAERVFKTRKEKVDFVKEIFAELEPRLQQFDEMMTSWEGKPGDEEIQIKDISDSLDFIKKRLTKIQPFFDTKSTYFTKNKIEIKNLVNLLKQTRRAFSIVYKSLKPATETGDIKENTREKVLEKLKKISTVIAKYIGPANKIGKAPIPEVPVALDDEEGDTEKVGTEEEQETIKQEFLAKVEEQYKPLFEKVVDYLINKNKDSQKMQESQQTAGEFLQELNLKDLFIELREKKVLKNTQESQGFIAALRDNEETRNAFLDFLKAIDSKRPEPTDTDGDETSPEEQEEEETFEQAFKNININFQNEFRRFEGLGTGDEEKIKEALIKAIKKDYGRFEKIKNFFKDVFNEEEENLNEDMTAYLTDPTMLAGFIGTATLLTTAFGMGFTNFKKNRDRSKLTLTDDAFTIVDTIRDVHNDLAKEETDKVEVTKEEFSELINTADDLITKMKESHKKFQEATLKYSKNMKNDPEGSLNQYVEFVANVIVKSLEKMPKNKGYDASYFIKFFFNNKTKEAMEGLDERVKAYKQVFPTYRKDVLEKFKSDKPEVGDVYEWVGWTIESDVFEKEEEYKIYEIKEEKYYFQQNSDGDAKLDKNPQTLEDLKNKKKWKKVLSGEQSDQVMPEILKQIQVFLNKLPTNTAGSLKGDEFKKAYDELVSKIDSINPRIYYNKQLNFSADEAWEVLVHNKGLLKSIDYYEKDGKKIISFSFLDSKQHYKSNTERGSQGDPGSNIYKTLLLVIKEPESEGGSFELEGYVKRGSYNSPGKDKSKGYLKVLNSLKEKLKLPPDNWVDGIKQLLSPRRKLEEQEALQEQIEKKLEVIIERFINQRKQQWRKRTM